MKDRPILYNSPMVRAILSGEKTQTRRIVKGAPDEWYPMQPQTYWPTITDKHGEDAPGSQEYGAGDEDGENWIKCPYGQPGDRLWVRENFAHIYKDNSKPINRLPNDCAYKADGFSVEKTVFGAWKPSIHMPRWASRISLEITGVRVERLKDISDADAIAEGCSKNHNGYYWGGPHPEYGTKQMATPVSAFRDLWNSINGAGSWEANPWVWVVEFKRIQPLPVIDSAQSAI